MDEVKYRYKLSGVGDVSALVGIVGGKRGVVSAWAEGEDFFYVLSDGADEYSVMVAAIKECERQGGRLIIPEDGEIAATEEAAEDNADNEVIDGLIVEEKQEIPDYEYEEDRIVSAKKKIKKDNIERFIELGVSLMILIVSLFFKNDETTAFSFKNVLLTISFAVAAYDTLYTAVSDIVKKKWWSENIYISLTYIAGALLGLVFEITVFALVFAVGKQIETFVKAVNELRIDDTFFTGSFSVLCNGEKKAIKDIDAGDEIELERYDVVPCDGVLLSAATVDNYKIDLDPERSLNEGEEVFAGAVILSDGAKIKVLKKNEESRIAVEKKGFEEKLTAYEKTPYALRFVLPAAFLAATVFIILSAILSESGFNQGLFDNRHIALYIVFLACLMPIDVNIRSIGKSTVITEKTLSVDFSDRAALKKLSAANSFVFDAAVLTEDGEIKEGAMKTLKELLRIGAKKVTTDFTGAELKKEVADRIDFVDKPLKNEKKVAVGLGKDISLGEKGSIEIENKELSALPRVFRVALRYRRARIFSCALSFAAIAASAALAVIFGGEFSVLFALPLIAAYTAICLISTLALKARA